MDILDKLRELEAYYATTRAVGHTYTMMHGALNTSENIIILAHDMRYARGLALRCGGLRLNRKGVIPLGLDSLEHGLRGHRRPLLIDNSAMWWLLQEAIEEVEKLRRVNAMAKGLEIALKHQAAFNEVQRRIIRERNRQLRDAEAKLAETWDYRLRALWQVIRGRLNI